MNWYASLTNFLSCSSSKYYHYLKSLKFPPSVDLILINSNSFSWGQTEVMMVSPILNLLSSFLTLIFSVQFHLSHIHSTSFDGDLHSRTPIVNFRMISNLHLDHLETYSWICFQMAACYYRLRHSFYIFFYFTLLLIA